MLGKTVRFAGIDIVNNALIKTHPNYDFFEMEKLILNQQKEGNLLLLASLLTTLISQI